MNDKDAIKIIAEMQLVVEQMRLDDLEENPSLAQEFFDCQCCGKYQPLAGSIEYLSQRFCNDCVLLAETGLALGKIKNVQELIDSMEDRRLEEICEFIKENSADPSNN